MKLLEFLGIKNPLKHLKEPLLNSDLKSLDSVHAAQLISLSCTGNASSFSSKINKFKPYALMDFLLILVFGGIFSLVNYTNQKYPMSLLNFLITFFGIISMIACAGFIGITILIGCNIACDVPE